ncbi:MAG TPA: outer membrane beta-barrel protein [Gemmatimonadaceae bacterium]
MRRLHRILIAAASVIAIGTPAVAQAPLSGKVLHISPYAGVMMFGDYLDGPLGTRLTNAPGALYGAQVGLSLAPELSLIGNVGYTASDMEVGVPILGGVSVGHGSMLIYDAGLEYNLGSLLHEGMPMSPFVQAGVGAIRYDIDAASVLSTKATNFAANIGAGADVTLGNGFALRLLARDFIGKFNFKDATGLGISGNTSHNWAFSAGMRFDF